MSKIIPVLLLIPIILVLYNYEIDSKYLKIRTADSIWFSYEPNLEKIVSKGDYLTYKKEKFEAFSDWNIYQERFQNYIDIINSENSPKMFENYTITTKFKQLGDKIIVDFYIYNKNLSIHKFSPIKHSSIIGRKIDFKSLIPSFIGLAMSFTFLTNALSQVAVIASSASISTSYSLFIALWKIIVDYTSTSIKSNDFLAWYLILGSFLSILFLSLFTYSGALKYIRKLNKYIYASIPILFNIFPYISTIFTTWWFRAKINKKDGAFLSLVFSVIISFIIFFKVSIYALLLHSSSIVLASFAISFLINSKNANRYIDALAKSRYNIKSNKFFNISIFLAGILSFITFKLIGKADIINITYTILILLTVNIIWGYKNLIFSSQDLLGVALRALLYSFIILIFILLSFMLYYSLLDLGTPSYLVSFIDKVRNIYYLPIIVFFISLLISISISNGLLSYLFLAPFITKISGTQFDPIIIKTAIIEGIILGEIISPMSLSKLIISKIYKIRAISILQNLHKLLLITILITSFSLFLMSIHLIYGYIFNILLILGLVFYHFYNYKKRTT